MSEKIKVLAVLAGLVLLIGVPLMSGGADDFQKQVGEIKEVLPKFAIPMREVGDRFQNMYHAAKSGNWALAFYMSKYMNKAMNPAKLTKPNEYPDWQSFYHETFEPVNKAILAQDFQAFSKEYDKVINSCNDCHSAMGYDFIKVIKLEAPPDRGIDYSIESKASDVPQ